MIDRLPATYRWSAGVLRLQKKGLSTSGPSEGQNNFRFVIPAKAGIQFLQYPAVALDPGLRRDDGLFRRSVRDFPSTPRA